MSLLLVLFLVGCSEEEATPIELGPTATTAEGRSTSGADATGGGDRAPTPHALGENPLARAHAEEQCRTNPDQEQGVIRIVDPANDAVLGEVVVDCDDVRTADAGG